MYCSMSAKGFICDRGTSKHDGECMQQQLQARKARETSPQCHTTLVQQRMCQRLPLDSESNSSRASWLLALWQCQTLWLCAETQFQCGSQATSARAFCHLLSLHRHACFCSTCTYACFSNTTHLFALTPHKSVHLPPTASASLYHIDS